MLPCGLGGGTRVFKVGKTRDRGSIYAFLGKLKYILGEKFRGNKRCSVAHAPTRKISQQMINVFVNAIMSYGIKKGNQ